MYMSLKSWITIIHITNNGVSLLITGEWLVNFSLVLCERKLERVKLIKPLKAVVSIYVKYKAHI